MIHILAKYEEVKDKIDKRKERATSVVLAADVPPPEAALCLTQLGPEDSLTTTALASDCDACRTKLGIANTNDKTWSGAKIGVHPVPEWEAQPMADADALIESAMKNRG